MPTPEEEKAAEEARKAEEQRIADLANKVAADHIKRAMSKFEKQLEERDQKIAQLEAAQAGGREKEQDKPAQGGKPDDPAEKRIRELEARMQERDRKLEEERRAREEERKQRLKDEERSAAQAALAEAEITGQLQKGALLTLMSEGKIGRDEAGNVCFLEQKEGYVDKIPVAEGVKKWAEGEGKAYLPAKGIGGSGTKPPVRAPSGKTGNDRNSKVAEAKRDLAAAFFGTSVEKG